MNEPESAASFYARAMLYHVLDPCSECSRLRRLVRMAHPEADKDARFKLWMAAILYDRPTHAIDIETDFALAVGKS
jgi:hypothetical protein